MNPKCHRCHKRIEYHIYMFMNNAYCSISCRQLKIDESQSTPVSNSLFKTISSILYEILAFPFESASD